MAELSQKCCHHVSRPFASRLLISHHQLLRYSSTALAHQSMQKMVPIVAVVVPLSSLRCRWSPVVLAAVLAAAGHLGGHWKVLRTFDYNSSAK
jgi:hypothetical protein